MNEHAEYPHEPGTLYDCEACESECFCERIPGSLEYTQCVFCASLAGHEAPTPNPRWYGRLPGE